MLDPTLISTPSDQIIQIDNLTVRIANTSKESTEDAANLAIKYLQSLLDRQKIVRIVLATGNSQLEFLKAIARNQNLDWSRIVLFHLDEYLGINPEHPGSFRYYLYNKVEKKVNPLDFNYIQGNAIEPIAECDRYSKLLAEKAIDLCLLGIGDNGHLAFNEPNLADFNDPRIVKLVKLTTKTRQQQVNGGYFPNLEAVPQYAYTLTIPAICAAKKIFCLAIGKHKAEVVKKTLSEEISPLYPATFLRRQTQGILFCDRNSFCQLKIE